VKTSVDADYYKYKDIANECQNYDDDDVHHLNVPHNRSLFWGTGTGSIRLRNRGAEKKSKMK